MRTSLWSWLLLILWWSAFGVATAAPLEPDVQAIEDPRRLEAMADEALAAGDREQARLLLEAMLKRQEVSRYLDYRKELREALVLERLGEIEAAADQYRAGFRDDVMRAVHVLRILSVHPDRDALVEEAYAFTRELVEIAKAGGDANIYSTSKDEPRYLKVYTQAQVLEEARKGRPVQYCYVEALDLTGVEDLPPSISLNRCVVGSIRIPARTMEKFTLRGLVLGDADFGKTWEGVPNKSRTLPPSVFDDLVLRETIFVGRANFSGVVVRKGRAYFPMVIFEGEADFRGAEFFGDTEFRYASFGAGANFKHLRMHAPVYFGGTRYRADTVFTGLYSKRDVYFDSTTFEGAVSFDKCEFLRGATFENARFGGPASLQSTRIEMNLNFSRATFEDTLNVKEVEVGELDALGAHFQKAAWFMDAQIRGRARFSIDEVTRHAVREDIDALLPLYRHYQGDEDADQPLTTRSSYGVTSLDDLTAQVDADISFANSVFRGYTVFEGVRFGLPEQPSVASFFNAQFLGETHFERTDWHAQADFTTIFGQEIAFNEARFHRSLILDDAAVTTRISLTRAEFVEDADVSFFGAELASFQIEPGQLATEDGFHRLFYERCARGDLRRDDVRLVRMQRGEALDDDRLRQDCYDNLIDEFVSLKQSYGDRAMTAAEDDAYWWARHHQAIHDYTFASGAVDRVWTVAVDLFLFELCFGWGVRLGNLAIAVIVVTVIFAVLYRVLCPDTVLAYDGDDVPIKEVPFIGLCFVSLQSLIAVNTGWDFGADDHTFRWLNTLETLIGFIILTFFVGAYTRMILA